jgi:hypothetical protein
LEKECQSVEEEFCALRETINPTDLEKARGLYSQICPESSRVAYQAISIRAEVPSAAEGEEGSVPITFPRMKAEPEVSCLSVATLGGFHWLVGW